MPDLIELLQRMAAGQAVASFEATAAAALAAAKLDAEFVDEMLEIIRSTEGTERTPPPPKEP